MPKVSIIVPIYNMEKYLEKCVESLINQTLKDIEIILVDDGSKDSSGKIVDSYAIKDYRIKVIHKNNGGLSSTRNVGLEYATGDFVGFVDADDWMDINAYKKMYDTALEEKCDVVACASFNVYKNEIRQSFKSDNIYINLNETTLSDFGINYFDVFSTSVCNKIYKRNIIEKNKLLFIDNKIMPSEDQMFNVMFLVHATKIRILPDRFYYCVRHYGSITTTKKKDPNFVIKMVSMASFLQDYAIKNNKDIGKWLPFLYFNFFICGLGNIEKNGVNDISKQIFNVSKEKLFVTCFEYTSKFRNYKDTKISIKRSLFAILFSKLLLYRMFILAALMQVAKRRRLEIKNYKKEFNM